MEEKIIKMVEERKQIEAKIMNLISEFQSKYKCGLKIHEYYALAVGDIVDTLVDIRLEIRK